MIRTKPFASIGIPPVRHRERGNELLLVADTWMNIQHHYRADACATLAIAHYYAFQLGGDIRNNPKDGAIPETPDQHIARALALINGAEIVLAHQNYANTASLASVAVAHFMAAVVQTNAITTPIPRQD